MDYKQKILISGDVRGAFKQLFNRVDAVNKKSGPFEFLLCVGSFFSKDDSELTAYKNGFKNVPIPTYILGPNNQEEDTFYEDSNDGEICTNLSYLGKRGLYTISSGIKIAYVSGLEGQGNNSFTFNIDDLRAVKQSCINSRLNMGEYRGIDILITSQWPAGVKDDDDNNSSKLLSWLALEIKPRYHFCGLKGQYFERPPYRNPLNSITQLELATRFISLAYVGNSAKDKFLYAMSIAPVDKMKILDLIQKTTDETPCPYVGMEFINDKNNEQVEQSQQFFYDMTDRKQGEKKRKGQGYSNDNKKLKYQSIDQEKCWFCLSSASVEKHLVISIGKHFYLALAKGPLNDQHILILSITHISCSALLSGDEWKELAQFKQSIRKYFRSIGKIVTFFERHYKSSHLQINAVSTNDSCESLIRKAFQEKCDEYNISFDIFPIITEASQLPITGPYFVAELPDNSTIIIRQMKMFPLHFGREAFSGREILNCENKIDWRECQISKDIETSLVKKFRESYKQFDFTV